MRFSAQKLSNFLFKEVSNAPLVGFRIFFGGLLLYASLRTLSKGWVDDLYVTPTYHFGFFDGLVPLGQTGMYLVYGAMSFAALGIMFGFLYRINTVLYWLLFTYVELLDKTYYLNHYYLVTLLTFWLIWVPAHHAHSIDSKLFSGILATTCSRWHIAIFQVQLSMVYFYAGLAKVNSDWLIHAQPLATWLPAKYGLPVLGPLMKYKTTAFVFSWMGCFYDLFIWIFLLIRKTRVLAYIAVIGFHVITVILFPRIGMFPYIMITATLVFFSADWHKSVLGWLPNFSFSSPAMGNPSRQIHGKRLISVFLCAYIALQLYLPLRYLRHEGNLFWHERGYRFSWRVMLMEKSGYTAVIVKDPKTGVKREVEQCDYLTAFQQQQMRSQPDMLFQFAHHIGDEFEKKKGYAPQVYVKSRLSLNGRRSQVFTDETVDLYSFSHPFDQNWIVPLK